MKNNDMMILAAAAAIAWWLIKPKGGAAGRAAPSDAGAELGAAGAEPYTTQVAEWNGWRYYSNGAGIGPDGKIYYQGNAVDGAVLR